MAATSLTPANTQAIPKAASSLLPCLVTHGTIVSEDRIMTSSERMLAMGEPISKDDYQLETDLKCYIGEALDSLSPSARKKIQIYVEDGSLRSFLYTHYLHWCVLALVLQSSETHLFQNGQVASHESPVCCTSAVQFVYIFECYLGRELAEGQRGRAGYRRNRQGVHPQVGSGVGCEVSVCVWLLEACIRKVAGAMDVHMDIIVFWSCMSAKWVY